MAMRDVELVEDGPPERVPASGDRRPPSRGRSRLVTAVALTLVAALAVAVVLQLRVRAADAARADAMRALPGVLAPVDPALPVGERLTLDGGASALVAALVQGVLAGDVAVVGVGDETGSAVAGVDLATGTEAWRVPVPAPQGHPDAEAGYVWCTGPQEDAPPTSGTGVRRAVDGLVGCVATWRAGSPASSDGQPDLVAVLAVDPAGAGRVVHRADLPLGAAATRLRDGWVVLSAAGGAVVVDVLDDAGPSRWRTVLDGATALPPWNGAVVGDGRVLVPTVDAGAWVLALADGAVVQQLPTAHGLGGRLLPGGGTLLTDAGRQESAGELYRPDGTLDDLDGERLLPVEVDDGSLGDVLLTSRPGVSGHVTLRRADGTPVWRASPPLSHAMVVEGTVVGLAAGEVVRLDGADGGVVWRAPRPVGDPYPQLLTDGAAVIVTTTRGVDAWTFDGAPAWSGRLDEDGTAVRPVAPDPTPAAAGDPSHELYWSVTPDARLIAQVVTPFRQVLLVLG